MWRSISFNTSIYSFWRLSFIRTNFFKIIRTRRYHTNR
ncbi:hypothetical protein EVA_21278 [gut metagenome]|uniref:Uncharacterized protein n=1 Tax=gut metagenome TaxID=749906 RepID=J9BSU4_9ZZZZ